VKACSDTILGNTAEATSGNLRCCRSTEVQQHHSWQQTVLSRGYIWGEGMVWKPHHDTIHRNRY